jgi:hypothetical protein
LVFLFFSLSVFWIYFGGGGGGGGECFWELFFGGRGRRVFENMMRRE